MYYKKFVACIKANDKVLTEKGDSVYLPYGSEYSIFLKNENNQNAVVKIEIDGEIIAQNISIKPKEKKDILGYLKTNRAFKFIERTEPIENFRGSRPEDGLIKIYFKFEKHSFEDIFDKFKITEPCRPYQQPDIFKPQHDPFSPYCDGKRFGDGIYYATNTADTTLLSSNSIVDTKGITVEGSGISQNLTEDSGLSTFRRYEDEEIIIFQLKGMIENHEITEEITTKTKKQCSSCGQKFKFKYNYCPYDGTYLR